MTWYTLASTSEDHSELVARFLPGEFITDSTQPVLVLRVRDPVDRQTVLETLGKIRDSVVVEYTTTPTTFTVLLESDWEESSINGASVEMSQEPYSADELM